MLCMSLTAAQAACLNLSVLHSCELTSHNVVVALCAETQSHWNGRDAAAAWNGVRQAKVLTDQVHGGW